MDRTPRTWDDRTGWKTEVSVGNGIGALSGRDESGGRRSAVVADTTIRVGFHHVGRFHGKSILGIDTSSLAWCMPIACGPVGVLVGPESGFLGNELGVDLGAHLLHGVSGDASQLGYAFSIRPSFRVARDSRFRTASLLGALAPEVGFAFPAGRAHEIYFELNLYPVAMTLTRDVAIQWEPLRERLSVPLDGARTTFTVATAMSVVLL